MTMGWKPVRVCSGATVSARSGMVGCCLPRSCEGTTPWSRLAATWVNPAAHLLTKAEATENSSCGVCRAGACTTRLTKFYVYSLHHCRLRKQCGPAPLLKVSCWCMRACACASGPYNHKEASNRLATSRTTTWNTDDASKSKDGNLNTAKNIHLLCF